MSLTFFQNLNLQTNAILKRLVEQYPDEKFPRYDIFFKYIRLSLYSTDKYLRDKFSIVKFEDQFLYYLPANHSIINNWSITNG